MELEQEEDTPFGFDKELKYAHRHWGNYQSVHMCTAQPDVSDEEEQFAVEIDDQWQIYTHSLLPVGQITRVMTSH